jgi:peroxiredoxin
MRNSWIAALVVTMLVRAPTRAQDGPSPDRADTALTTSQRIESLRDEYQRAMSDFLAASEQAKTNEERLRVQRERLPNKSQYAARMFALAEANPHDPATVDALIFCVKQGSGTLTGAIAISRLAETYASDPRVAQIIELLPPLAPPSEALLRAVAEKGASRSTRGLATLMLGRLFIARAEALRILRDEPERTRQIESRMVVVSLDEAAFRRFRDTAPETVAREAVAAFERVVKDFGDVEYMATTLGKAAGGELYELRNLGIGMPCPEIAGEDIDGKVFRLSDFKGKVVLVVFCGDWCAPCRGLYPHERSLVKTMEGRPFVLVGVNSDDDRGTPRRLMEDEQITWRSWWDDGGRFGRIATQFNVRGWPTIYAIDHKGLIRYKWFGGPSDVAIEKLVQEAERGRPDAAEHAGR